VHCAQRLTLGENGSRSGDVAVPAVELGVLDRIAIHVVSCLRFICGCECPEHGLMSCWTPKVGADDPELAVRLIFPVALFPLVSDGDSRGAVPARRKVGVADPSGTLVVQGLPDCMVERRAGNVATGVDRVREHVDLQCVWPCPAT